MIAMRKVGCQTEIILFQISAVEEFFDGLLAPCARIGNSANPRSNGSGSTQRKASQRAEILPIIVHSDGYPSGGPLPFVGQGGHAPIAAGSHEFGTTDGKFSQPRSCCCGKLTKESVGVRDQFDFTSSASASLHEANGRSSQDPFSPLAIRSIHGAMSW